MRQLLAAVACLIITVLLPSAAPESTKGSIGSTSELDASAPLQSLVISSDGGELARVPLPGKSFAVSYRNSIYGTLAEERYLVRPDGSYLLVEIAADQLAVLEEYYAVPGAPSVAGASDRRKWTVDPDPSRPAAFKTLSLAATDLGQRTLHVPGAPPLELWSLVEDTNPFVELHLEETP